MDNALLVGPFIGELWWEIFKFAPHILWKKLEFYKHNDVKLIVFTRPDRFDLYGQHASILVPFRIPGDNTQIHQECYRMVGLKHSFYKKLIKEFYDHFNNRFNILEIIYPPFETKKQNRFLYPKNQRLFDQYKPRKENKIIIDKYINNDKPIIILAPRYRTSFEGVRNWKNWIKFYDLIYQNKNLMNKYNFIICGKKPDYVTDPENRFLDINKIPLSKNTSLIGLTIEIMKKNSILTIGTQSAISNLSIVFGIETIQWGIKPKDVKIHDVSNSGKTTFFKDEDYDISENIIYETMMNSLKEK